MMDRIDFRSDTVTWPTDLMRYTMAHAEVGDDVYGEDPTVNKLERLAATKVGKEAALFVSSGTMGNLIAMLTHAGRGDEAILGQDAHIYLWENGGMAAYGGIMPHPLPTDAQGRMSMADIEAAVRHGDVHHPRSRLILVENSYGSRNGFPLPVAYFAQVKEVADRHGLAVHMDGARFFNGVIGAGATPIEMAAQVDSLSFCLSKGLCAPVGSMLCGSASFIAKARVIRKSLGGGMRQAGILAAAGILALEEMVDRLGQDHERAQQLAQGLARIPGIIIEPDMVRTNIVYFSLAAGVPFTAEDVARRMRASINAYLGVEGPRDFRLVTHYWITAEHIALLLETLHTLLRVRGATTPLDK